ncbi:MAG: hypothetical protein IT181_13035 [Acidobacteria bacterium]|nr:hypothetical protein [Acidobacteriota bacterium]
MIPVSLARPNGPAPRPTARRRTPERAEQAAGVKLLWALGAKVYVFGTTRKRGDHQGTMQTPGIADVEFFLPDPKVKGSYIFAKWEVKADGGRLSTEQALLRGLCFGAGINHILGPCNALIHWLIQQKALRPEQVPHYRQP